MNKVIIISVDCVLNSTTGEPYPDIVAVLGKLKESGDKIIFLSHNTSKLDRAKQIFPQGKVITRENIRLLIKRYSELSFVIVGCHDEDVYVATNTKRLLLTAGWSNVVDKLAIKYGLVIPSAKSFFKTLSILKNHSAWFFELTIDDKSKVYALMNARTKFSSYGAQEVQLIEGFQSLLKRGDRYYFDVLLYHFLSGISNNSELREIQDWTIFPSSGCSLNREMWEFKERIRYLMFGRKEKPIFIRHTPIGKSHYIKNDIKRIPCDRHFASIIINPYYHGKLKNRAVCVLDDFLTNGTSFETARNLLLAEKVKKIIFVSLGTFSKPYVKQDYKIHGDVSKVNGYRAQYLKSQNMTGQYNEGAMIDIENLVSILSQ